MVLQHVGPGGPGRGRQAPGPFHLPGPVVAQPEQADRPVGHQLPERGDLLLQRNPGLVRHVRVVQVDPLHAEAFPAPRAGLPDRRAGQPLARGVEAGRRRDGPGPDLRGHDDLVTDTAAGAPPAEHRLALAALRAVHEEQVVVRGVDKVPARRDVPVQDRERRRLVGPRAEPHRAEAEHADLARRRRVTSDGRVSHAPTLAVRARSKSTPRCPAPLPARPAWSPRSPLPAQPARSPRSPPSRPGLPAPPGRSGPPAPRSPPATGG